MSYFTFVALIGLLAGGRLGYAQRATGTTTLEPCGQVSSILASYSSANPSATQPAFLDVSLCQACAASVPIDVNDATRLLDGIAAMLQFQSDLEFLASPPSGYLLAGVDLLSEISNLRSQVESGSITGEIDFETRLVTILASAHDGHLACELDGLSVFGVLRPVQGIVSVSEDGTSLPKVYLTHEYLYYANGTTTDAPSAITQVNGVDVEQFINNLAQNSTLGDFQDPDALYNAFFYSWNDGQGVGPSSGLFTGFKQQILQPYTNLTFENGTVAPLNNVVIARKDFTGVVDGESFYASFINATNKVASVTATAAPTGTNVPLTSEAPEITSAYPTASASATSSATPTAVSQIDGYPAPVVISEDGALSGYFLSDSNLDDTAVLSLRFMTEDGQVSFQQSLSDFLDACRSSNKTHLIVDLTGNPGGSTILGYEVFKQLFPTLDPYGAGNFRAHEGLRLLGEVATAFSTQVMEQEPDNYTAFALAGGTSWFDSDSSLDANGTPYQSFDEFYGPLSAPNNYGNYTNLSRYDLPDPQFDVAQGSIVVSGYGNRSNIPPQLFDSSNIIMLIDGQCSSTCTILAHFLKYQGKVKSITIGGRPQTGPMQAVGGIKGSQVYVFAQLAQAISIGYRVINQQTATLWDNSVLGTIYKQAEYLVLRTASGGSASTELSFNNRNNIAEGDDSLTPLQYIYEAADCRIFYQPSHIVNITNLWATVATQSFGLNGTEVFSGCVAGSTNQQSSLSGDPAFYNGGNPQNASDEQAPGNGSGSSNGGGSPNGGENLKGSAVFALIVGVVVVLML